MSSYWDRMLRDAEQLYVTQRSIAMQPERHADALERLRATITYRSER